MKYNNLNIIKVYIKIRFDICIQAKKPLPQTKPTEKFSCAFNNSSLLYPLPANC